MRRTEDYPHKFVEYPKGHVREGTTCVRCGKFRKDWIHTAYVVNSNKEK